jgi:hypothetical protein
MLLNISIKRLSGTKNIKMKGRNGLTSQISKLLNSIQQQHSIYGATARQSRQKNGLLSH